MGTPVSGKSYYFTSFLMTTLTDIELIIIFLLSLWGYHSIVLDSKISIENGDNGKKNIVITEIPFQVNKASMLQKIAKYRDANPNGPMGYIARTSDKKTLKWYTTLYNNSGSLVDSSETQYNKANIEYFFIALGHE